MKKNFQVLGVIVLPPWTLVFYSAVFLNIPLQMAWAFSQLYWLLCLGIISAIAK